MSTKSKHLGAVVAQVQGIRIRHNIKGQSGFGLYYGKKPVPKAPDFKSLSEAIEAAENQYA